MMIQTDSVDQATQVLRAGGTIAYPTEGVFGLGCDPKNKKALGRLLQTKQRAPQKGFILIGHSWADIEDFILPVLPPEKAKLDETWPGPVTWLLPAKPEVDSLLKGQHETVAVRLSAHPIVQALCQAYGGALVSTSANLSSEPPCREASEVATLFATEIDLLLLGQTGGLDKPTPIYDLKTGRVIRA